MQSTKVSKAEPRGGVLCYDTAEGTQALLESLGHGQGPAELRVHFTLGRLLGDGTPADAYRDLNMATWSQAQMRSNATRSRSGSRSGSPRVEPPPPQPSPPGSDSES